MSQPRNADAIGPRPLLEYSLTCRKRRATRSWDWCVTDNAGNVIREGNAPYLDEITPAALRSLLEYYGAILVVAECHLSEGVPAVA